MAETLGKFGCKARPGIAGADVYIFQVYGSQGEDGHRFLSWSLMSDYEIDYFIQACKEDLDHVGELAKRKLKRANQKTHELIKAERTRLGSSGR